MIDYTCVILIKDSIVDECFLYYGKYETVAEAADLKFIELCQSCVSNWDEYTQVDIDNILDDGYYEYGNGNSICITSPTLNAD